MTHLSRVTHNSDPYLFEPRASALNPDSPLHRAWGVARPRPVLIPFPKSHSVRPLWPLCPPSIVNLSLPLRPDTLGASPDLRRQQGVFSREMVGLLVGRPTAGDLGSGPSLPLTHCVILGNCFPFLGPRFHWFDEH